MGRLLSSTSFFFAVAHANDSFLPHRARGGSAYRDHLSRVSGSAPKKQAEAAIARFWEHPLDNNNASSEVFKSKYYVDTSNYREDGPSFLYIGGEGPMAGPASGLITNLASDHGAKIYSLEHRFYGDSLPEHSVDIALSVEYLKFHTVEQSLADLAKFIQVNTAGEEWFAVGGSYPGALSSKATPTPNR